MKASTQFATIVACTLVFSISAAKAQSVSPRSSAPASGDRVAVIDINYIFKNHNRFKKMVEDWKTDLKVVENQFRKQNDEIKNLAERASQFEIGSPDYKRLETDVAKRRADLQVKMQLQKKDLMEREAKMYLNIYNEIQKHVNYFARTHNITLVLRFNREPIKAEDPRAIQQGLLRPVVYQNQIDITEDILRYINPPAADARGNNKRPFVPGR